MKSRGIIRNVSLSLTALGYAFLPYLGYAAANAPAMENTAIKEKAAEYSTNSPAELKQIYDKKLRGVCSDKKVNWREVKELDDIVTAFIKEYEKNEGKSKEVMQDFKTKLLDDRKNIENKIIASYEARIQGKKPLQQMSIDELAFYVASSRLIDIQTQANNQKQAQKTSENAATSLAFTEYKNVYDRALKNKDKWIKSDSVNKKYWNIGVLGFFLGGEGDSPYLGTSGSNEFSNIFLKQGFEIELEGLRKEFPVKTKIPPYIGLPLGFIGPFLRKLLLLAYYKQEWDNFDIAESIVEGLMFGCMADAIHPLVFPIRMLGWPFIEEPIRKLIGETRIQL